MIYRVIGEGMLYLNYAQKPTLAAQDDRPDIT